MKKVAAVCTFLDAILPNAGCELQYHTPFQLLIAVMLSAQTTDKSVNQVTPLLFERFPTIESLANADVEEIRPCIERLGLSKQKAKHCKGIAQKIMSDFNGEVPEAKADLMTLSGVGQKTANVVRAEIFHFPEFAVDTHVERIAKRLQFALMKDSVFVVEEKLKKAFPKERYILTHHQMIHFGRTICKASRPLCTVCHLQAFCCFQFGKLEIT